MRNVYFDDECDLFFDQYEGCEIEEDGMPVDLSEIEEDYV